jgi:ABC-2 type transport system permease protein
MAINKHFFNQIWAFADRSFREIVRNKMVLFWLFVWPLFWFFLSVFLFIAPYTPGGEALGVAIGINAISMGIFAVLTSTMVGFSIDFAEDINLKRYRLYRSYPIHPLADFLGRFFTGFIFGCLSFGIIIIIAYIIGARIMITLFSIPVIVLSLLLLSFIGMGVGLIIANLSNNPSYAVGFSLVILMLLFFITGYNGTLTSMFPGPKWMLNIIPNSLATRIITLCLINFSGFRYEDANVSPPSMPGSPLYIIILLVYGILFLLVGYILMRKYQYQKKFTKTRE